MERTNPPKLYNVQEEPIVLSKSIMDLLLQHKNYRDLLALYAFYYYTAKWQQTNQPRVTTEYAMVGTKLSYRCFRDAKKQLIELKLIEDISNRNAASGKITGHYVRVNFIWSNNKNHPAQIPECGEPQTLVNDPVNALSTNRGNALSTGRENTDPTDPTIFPQLNTLDQGPITPTMFDRFWTLYPRHVDKGKALKAWERLCKHKDRPKWYTVEHAIQAQIKSERWQDKQYIPHPTTWLNQYRWLDDAQSMTNGFFTNDQTQPHVKQEKMLVSGRFWYLDKASGLYFNKDGEQLMTDLL